MAIPRLSKKPPRPAPFQRWRWGKPSPSPRGVLLAPEGPRLQHVHRVLRLRRCQCARKCLKYVTLPLVWLGTAARDFSRAPRFLAPARLRAAGRAPPPRRNPARQPTRLGSPRPSSNVSQQRNTYPPWVVIRRRRPRTSAWVPVALARGRSRSGRVWLP